MKWRIFYLVLGIVEAKLTVIYITLLSGSRISDSMIDVRAARLKYKYLWPLHAMGMGLKINNINVKLQIFIFPSKSSKF